MKSPLLKIAFLLICIPLWSQTEELVWSDEFDSDGAIDSSKWFHQTQLPAGGGGFDPIFLPVAFILIAAAAIRLSFFSTFGLSDDAKYTGLALDNNSIVLVFIFLFETAFPNDTFKIALAIAALILATLNVSQVKTPKFSGVPRNVYLLAFYTILITVIYTWKLA